MPITVTPIPREKGFTIQEEDGTQTRVYFTNHGDLTIRQERPGSSPGFISSYSDAGLSIYAFLIKFLAQTGHRIPSLEKRGSGSSYRETAKEESQSIAMRNFPIRFYNEFSNSREQAHVREEGGRVFLEVESARIPIHLSLPVVAAIVQNIPKHVPDTGPYRIVRALVGRQRLEPRPPASSSARRIRGPNKIPARRPTRRRKR